MPNETDRTRRVESVVAYLFPFVLYGWFWLVYQLASAIYGS